MRERLIKILDQNPCPDGRLRGRECKGCPLFPPSECYLERMADHLIRHGARLGREDGDLISRDRLRAKIEKMRLPVNIYKRLCKILDDMPTEELE